jgi:hypothetical protein
VHETSRRRGARVGMSGAARGVPGPFLRHADAVPSDLEHADRGKEVVGRAPGDAAAHAALDATVVFVLLFLARPGDELLLVDAHEERRPRLAHHGAGVGDGTLQVAQSTSEMGGDGHARASSGPWRSTHSVAEASAPSMLRCNKLSCSPKGRPSLRRRRTRDPTR